MPSTNSDVPVNPLVIDDIRGGMDDQTPKHLLPMNKCVLARNVEFFLSALGERRLGCASITLTDSTLNTFDGIVHLGVFQPQQADIIESELWAVAATVGSLTSVTARRSSSGVWSVVTLKDAMTVTEPNIYRIDSQSLHGKFFVAYKSGQARLHVYDGSTLRRAGLAAPVAAPTAIDSSSGAYTGDRTFRVRYIEKSGAVILRRSEPSPELVFSPSGTGSGATVTRPALVNEGETHWELEASDGDGNFYIIATTVVATSTYTDTTQPATDYADLGDLSADLGEYDLFPSVRFLTADEDRLIAVGDFDDQTHGSRVCWSPVSTAVGVGNDERLPTDTNNFIDLDWLEGGDATGVSKPINGNFYVFKHQRIYKIQRTYEDVNQAYDSFLLTPSAGAIYGSVVDGMDEYGKGCTYFLDPQAGPCRISSGGLQYMRGLRNTWKSVNTNATKVAAHGVYYPDKQQVHWWVATDAADVPNYKIVCQVSAVQSNTGETSGGWSVADGDIATAYCSTVMPEIVLDSDTGAKAIAYRPYTGHLASMFIQRNDVGYKDNGTAYKAKIITRPYILAGLLNQWGAMEGALLANANDDKTVKLKVSFERDFGLETNTVQTDFLPRSTEDLVIKTFDNLVMSEAIVIQVVFEDP